MDVEASVRGWNTYRGVSRYQSSLDVGIDTTQAQTGVGEK
jgi:hypothetical protein